MFLLGNPRSISARLTLMNLLVSGVALLLAFASFLAYDTVAFRADLSRTLHTEAQILGANTVSAILFEDSQAANSTLSALRGSPEVISAVVLAQDGTIFAQYSRDGGTRILQSTPLPTGANEAQWSHGKDILYGSRIIFHGEQVGSIYLLAGTEQQMKRATLYALIAAMVLVLCLAIALLLTAAFRHLLTDPLIGLAHTAQIVRTEKDYAVRAQPSHRDDEVALLVRSFNDMLDDIQERDKELELSRAALEERVQQRTAELSAANKELEAFSYTVAHDLRGPLDTIGNLSFLLRQEYSQSLDADGRRYLNELLASTKKMSTLIQDLLNLSRASRTSFHRQVIDLSSMASSILNGLQNSEPGRSVEISVIAGATVLADEGLLCVVLENLLGNAWKYTSKQPRARIEFGSLTSQRQPVFFIRDNGAGFDPAYADRLFQPFQRLHVQAEFPGTGIGLATVQRIISRHGGQIWAESTPGHGATFFFTVPYSSNDATHI